MNNHIVRFFLIGVVLLAGAARGFAQNPPVPVTVKFTIMAWDVFDPVNDLELNYTGGGKARTIQVAWRDRSSVAECDGAGPLVFTRTVEREGKKIQVPVGTAQIPQGMTRALLVLGRNPSPGPGETATRVMVIDDSYAVFPGNSVRFLNYSQMTLGGALGEGQFEVAPGGDRVVPLAPTETSRLLGLRLARRDGKGGWRKMRSTMLAMSGQMRVLIFLLDDPANPERPEMVLLRDQQELAPELPVAGGTLAKASGLRVNPQVR